MKSLKYIALLMGFGAVALTSCNDFLDQLPDERTQIDTEEKVRQLLVTAYPTANYGWICELSSDNIMDNNANHLPISTSSEQITARYNLGSYGRQDDELYRFEPCVSSDAQDTPSYLWSGMYESIISANYALDGINKVFQETGEMTPELKKYRAEALLIRAYCHFILVNVFSQAYKDETASKQDQGVPYVDNVDYVTDFQHQYDRGTVADVYDKIERDLLEGLKDIGDALYAVKYHFNLDAAHAFAARFYLFKRDYEKVIEHANAVLTTDPTQMAQKLMKFDGFANCTYMEDYLQIYEDPNSPNNLMLLNTMSRVNRHGLGYRYANNSTRIREVYYHTTPWNGRYYAYPFIWQGGFTFWTGRDYGYFPAKCGEEFEYTDKLAGIGYVHTIRREFTCNMLLLERAEAEAMLGQYQACAADLIAYNHSLISFSETEMQAAAAVGVRDLTQNDIDTYFATPAAKPSEVYGKANVFANWDFTQRMSSKFVVPQEAVKYMNAVNEFRRIERLFEGDRFFDLKRWGIEYSHVYGNYNHAFEGEGSEQDEITYTMTWNDPRRALEVPQDAIQAGLIPSRPLINDPGGNEATVAVPSEGYFSKQ